jgi:hypothetical protein
MIVPLLFGLDLLLFSRLGIGEGDDYELLPCRAIALGKDGYWLVGITFWIDLHGYGGIINE